MTWALFLAAFGMGLFGSPHCLGMCGGIVTAFGLSMQQVSNSKKNSLIFTYHFGRLISYAILGLLASLLGVAIFQSFMSNSAPRMVLGAVLVLIGLAMLGLPLFNQLEKVGMRFWQSLAPVRKKVFPIDSFGKALFAGLLWGFLPCGLVYGALMMAIANNHVATGAALMFVFGLGTIPMLIATQKTVGVLQSSIKTFKLRQLNGVVMILSGLAVIFLPMLMTHNHAMGHHNMANHGATASAPMAMHHEAGNHEAMNNETVNHGTVNHETMNHAGMDHSKMQQAMPMTDDMAASSPHSMGGIDHSQMDHKAMMQMHSEMDHRQMQHPMPPASTAKP